MKIGFVLAAFAIVSCAQSKENREEFKDEHQVERKRVDGTADAAISSEGVPIDTAKIENKDQSK